MAEVVSVMQAYNLVRDDWDTVNELAHYSTTADPTNQIASKVCRQLIVRRRVQCGNHQVELCIFGTELCRPLLTYHSTTHFIYTPTFY